MNKHIIDIDKAMDIYIDTKRDISSSSTYGYDTIKNEFVEIETLDYIEENIVVFLNSNKIANEVIDSYLNRKGMEKHKKAFEKFYQTGNRVTDILWYFEHIDGAYPFEDFECLYVVDIIKKWCTDNGFSFIEPVVYKV